MDEVPSVPQIEFQRRALRKAVRRCVRVWPRVVADRDALGFPSRSGGQAFGRRVCDDGGPTARLGAELADTAAEDWALRRDVAWMWLAELFDVLDLFAGPMVVWSSRSRASVGVLWLRWADDYADRFPAGRKERAVWEVLPLRLYRLADVGRSHWPDPMVAGSVAGGVTVGARGSEVEVCKLCQEPIGGTVADPVKRLDGEPYHLRARPGSDRGSCFRRAWLSKGGTARLRSL